MYGAITTPNENKENKHTYIDYFRHIKTVRFSMFSGGS